jgi:hypothetical protein
MKRTLKGSHQPMAQTVVRLLVHLIFSTKDRANVITA